MRRQANYSSIDCVTIYLVGNTLVAPLLWLRFFHSLESVNKREPVESKHLFGPKEPDEHDDYAGQFKNEEQVEITGDTNVDAAGCR